MRFKALVRVLGSTALAASAGPALAQTPVPVEREAAYHHPHLAIEVPSQLAGFTRSEIVRYDDEQFNVGAQLRDESTSTFATLYIYRAGTPDLRIWGDRAVTMMLSNPALGKVDLDGIVMGNFTPPNGASADSGFRLSAPLSGKGWSSTGLAIFIHDGWLMKVRMSSRTLAPVDLQERLGRVTNALEMEPALDRQPAYSTMEDCPNRLEFRKEAKLVRLDITGSILFGSVFKMAADKAEPDAGKTLGKVACREKLTDAYAVYRFDEATKSYLVAFGDSGASATVDSFDASGLVKRLIGYTINLSDGVTNQIYPPFDRMPTPAQVYTVVNQLNPQVTIDVRPGSDGGVTISVSPPADTTND